MTQNQNNFAGKTITIPTFSERTRKLTALAIGVLCVFLIVTLLFAPFYKTTSFDEYGDKVNFMMINLTDGQSETKDDVKAFLGKTEYTFPVYYDTELDATHTYGAYSIPRTFIIDAEGNIVYGASGPVSEDTLVRYIKALIGE